MNPDYFKKVHTFRHDDERRYQLLIRGLRIIQAEKKQYSPLQKLKKEWNGLRNPVQANLWK